MHKSFPGDYERKGKTCSAVRLFVKKKKSRLEIQLLRVFRDMTFFGGVVGLRYRTQVAGDRYTSEIAGLLLPLELQMGVIRPPHQV